MTNWFLSKPKSTGILVFLTLFAIISVVSFFRFKEIVQNQDKLIAQITSVITQNINRSLSNSQTIAIAISHTVNKQGNVVDFEPMAEKLYDANPYVQAIQLVPNGVIREMYPIAGNKAAIGTNLFKSSNRQTIFDANLAVEKKKIYFQGGVKLVQGGIGVIGRLPIFIDQKFWGFSAVVIKLDTLLKLAGVNNNHDKGIICQFSKRNSKTNKEVFLFPINYDLKDRKFRTAFFTQGDWKLYVIGASRAQTLRQVVPPFFLLVVLSMLTAVLLANLIEKQAQLKTEIDNQAIRIYTAESKYKIVFDNATVGIAKVHSITGEFLEVNDFLCTFLGYQREELLSKKIKSVIYNDDLEEDAKMFKMLLKGVIRQFSAEKRYLKKDGKVAWGKVAIKAMWDDNEEPLNHILVVEDITQAKSNESRLTEAQAKVEGLINSIDGIVWEATADEDYSITFISKQVEDILGYSAVEWMGTRHFHALKIHPDDMAWAEDYRSNRLLTQTNHDLEYRMIAKDGTTVWFRNIITITFEKGKYPKLIGIMIDITDSKKAEEDLNKSFELVSEQNKRLLNFSHIVSHNLRSHASNIDGISGLIETAPTAEYRDEMIQLLKKVVCNLNDTLYNLNNVVNIQTSIDVIKEQLNLNDFILNTLNTQKAQILNKKATIVNNVWPEVEVTFNRAYLESVLLNLISNALRYSKHGRDLVITLNWIQEARVLLVSDNGVGIDMNKHGDKIFGLYQTFHGNADARGFGLFITKNQIDAMGGKIELQSALDQGSTFEIYFRS